MNMQERTSPFNAPQFQECKLKATIHELDKPEIAIPVFVHLVHWHRPGMSFWFGRADIAIDQKMAPAVESLFQPQVSLFTIRFADGRSGTAGKYECHYSEGIGKNAPFANACWIDFFIGHGDDGKGGQWGPPARKPAEEN